MIPFRQALFDTSFERFITRRVASVIWVLNIILIFISAIVFFIFCIYLCGDSFANNESMLGLGCLLVAFVGVPLFTFLWLVLTRLGIEASVALVSIAENTQALKGVPAGLSNISGTSPVTATQPPKVSKEKGSAPPLRAPELKLNADQAKFTVEDINAMISDFEITPNDFALDVLGREDHTLWVKAGKPDLKPWILLGLPNFALWLKTRKK